MALIKNTATNYKCYSLFGYTCFNFLNAFLDFLMTKLSIWSRPYISSCLPLQQLHGAMQKGKKVSLHTRFILSYFQYCKAKRETYGHACCLFFCNCQWQWPSSKRTFTISKNLCFITDITELICLLQIYLMSPLWLGHNYYWNNWSIPFRFLEFIDEQEG